MNQVNGQSHSDAILVLGGGISGITAAVEAAEMGCTVYVVERTASLGGRVAQMHQYFPKLCPPACGLEINYQRIRKNHDRIKILTLAEVASVSGEAGAFEVTLNLQPRFVNERCTACGLCEPACPVRRPRQFDYGLGEAPAIHAPHEMALPSWYVVERSLCPPGCAKCAEACPYGAVDLTMTAKTMKLSVGSIILATGWTPYDASLIANLGFGASRNIITNVMMERLAAPGGPTHGRILRPSDGKPVRTAAFVQCAGSRDMNHLPYCSGVCCMASLKQATYLRKQNPDAQVYIFYIDLRTPGFFEDFLLQVERDDKVVLKKGKVARVEEDPATGNLQLEVEDIMGGGKLQLQTDLVVLATGMVPNARGAVPLDLQYDEYGFCTRDAQPRGVVPAGLSKGPVDVASAIQDATGAVLEAIGSMRR
ncbi:MAG: CoB--CoM heterodisulfide reductase iron-sulfur subunit A family protein [bacterium]|nr:CoB--CoM heterodisulfide reductase iron-sulfur subunit A family protein [bacterium]